MTEQSGEYFPGALHKDVEKLFVQIEGALVFEDRLNDPEFVQNLVDGFKAADAAREAGAPMRSFDEYPKKEN